MHGVSAAEYSAPKLAEKVLLWLKFSWFASKDEINHNPDHDRPSRWWNGVIVQVEVGLVQIHSVTRIFVAVDVSFLSWAEI